MKGIALLIQLAFMAQAHAATETTSAEEDEAMNKLIDTLVDDDKNDELVDMITEKLVDKLLGFVGTVPQMAAMQLRAPMAEVRQIMQTPQQLPNAPDLQTNVGFEGLKPAQITENKPYDGSKLTRLPIEGQKTVRTKQGWGNQKVLIQGGAQPYANAKYPDSAIKAYKPSEPAKAAMDPQKGYVKDMRRDKPDSFTDKKKLAVLREDYQAGSELQKPNGFLGLSGSAQEASTEYAEANNGGNPLLMEEDYAEQPDPLTVLAVGILSAFVGSAATFALFHLRRSLTKTEMQAPLLN